MITVKPKACGECHRCCEGYLWGSAYGHQFQLNKPCGLLVGGRCIVYPNHPQDPCKTFHCAWKSNAAWPQELRPDHSNVIFLSRHLEHWSYWHGVNCGTWPTPDTIQWAVSYCRRTQQSFVLFRDTNTVLAVTPHADFLSSVRQRWPDFQTLWQN
jgi:hypothetical protein